ncbi:TPA: DUF1642 domain-containing protein [Streptococcus suis]|nr:DUF1642 domain-containing protein [Streptococcus suis]
MNKQYKIGDEVLVRGIVNSEVRNGGIHVLHDGVDAFYMLDQIHEPQKVVVPKFVAEWIKYCKSNELTLLGAFDPVSEHGIGLANTFTGEVWKGVDWAKCNQETFARAWLDGFEIEQEKLYEVSVPGTSNYKNQRQHLVKQGKHWFFCGNDVNRFKYRFTKGQIEAAGFGWVFDCDGVKVEEVE